MAATGSAPAAREDHTWTASGDGEVAYLFGGRGGVESGALADLWAYDLAADTWQQLAGGPPARFGHNAAWVPGVGLVIFAGQAGSTFYNDLWAYDPVDDTWRTLPAGGAAPVPRYGSCAALGLDGRLWISHGFTSEGARFADTRAYDFGTGAWTDETPVGDAPVERCLHGCWWTDDGRFILYAGQTTGLTALGDLWSLTVGSRPGTNAWVEAAPLPPTARNLYASTRWEGGTVVFGGQDPEGRPIGDVWFIWDDERPPTAYQESGEVWPSPRWGAELVTDETRTRFLLFGGRDADGTFDELWELTLP